MGDEKRCPDIGALLPPVSESLDPITGLLRERVLDRPTRLFCSSTRMRYAGW